jgi:hypothetical protein
MAGLEPLKIAIAQAEATLGGCRIDLAGASPTPTGPEAPGPRLPVEGETQGAKAQRQSTLWEGTNEPAAALLNAPASSVTQPNGVQKRQVAPVTTKATH